MEKIRAYIEELYPREGTCIERCDTLSSGNNVFPYPQVYGVRRACIGVCRDVGVKSRPQCVAACRDSCRNLDGDILAFTKLCVDACMKKPDLED